MTVTFYLNNDRKQNLYCRISDGQERAIFSLGCKVDNGCWDEKEEEPVWGTPHHYSIVNLKKYLLTLSEKMRDKGETEIPKKIKDTITPIVKSEGISGIDRFLFNKMKSTDVPGYDVFTKAFERFCKVKKGQYSVEVHDDQMWFYTEKGNYIGHTYEGLQAELNDSIARRSYVELYMTNLSAWNFVLMDDGEALGTPGIGKAQMYRQLFIEWRIYWDEKYHSIKDNGIKTSHLNHLKEDSWKALQVFMEGYAESTTPIHDAEELNMDLCACLILAMLNIYDKDTCLEEYCEYHFADWHCEEIDDQFIYFTENEHL